MLYFGSYDQNGKLDINKLKTELGKIGSVEGNEFPLKVTVNGYTFEITETGEVILYDPNVPEIEEIAAATEWTKLNRVSKLGGYNSSKGVNAPKLGSELTAVTLTDDLSSYTSDGTWYDYVVQSGTTESGGTSKWANAVTTDDDGTVTGYYVWIPRYAI